MLRTVMLFVCMCVFGNAAADPQFHTTWVLGCTLTQDWATFPGVLPSGEKHGLTPRFDGDPNNWYEQLDGQYQIWVAFENLNDPENPATQLPSPLSLQAFSATEPWHLYVYDSAAPGTRTETQYLYQCNATGLDLEKPAPGLTSITSSGEIPVKHIFGGNPGSTRMIFRRTTPNFDVFLVVAWAIPGTYIDFVTGLSVNAKPGDVVMQSFAVPAVGGGGEEIVGIYPMLIVNWSSSDFPGTSDGFVDSADLAVFASHLGTDVEWGFGTPPGTRTFQFNVNPFGNSFDKHDTGDLTVFANALGDDCVDNPSKSYTFSKTEILDWFGIGLTGETVVVGPSGETGPEYDILDQAKHRHAIENPYGYRSNVSAVTVKEAPWGSVKQLYR